MITADQIRRISKSKPPEANVKSLVDGLNEYGASVGVDQPHRLAQFLAQIMHEFGGLRYNKEIWGPTNQQKRYERDFSKPWNKNDKRNRVAFNLGNTEKGDGSLYRGYALGQITGRSNTLMFYNWCKRQGMSPPDFMKNPSIMATGPWSAIACLWFWDMKNLNPLADRGDIENITMRWNGGLTNYEDRLDYYDRAALVLLGYGVNELVQFQKDAKIDYKTGSGPITRGASLHKALVALTAKPEQAKTVQAAPVVEVEEVPVKLGNPDKPFWQSKEFVATALTGGGVTGTVSAVGTIPWQNLIILIVAAFLGLIAFLAWSRMQDAKKQEAKAEAIKS